MFRLGDEPSLKPVNSPLPAATTKQQETHLLPSTPSRTSLPFLVEVCQIQIPDSNQINMPANLDSIDGHTDTSNCEVAMDSQLCSNINAGGSLDVTCAYIQSNRPTRSTYTQINIPTSVLTWSKRPFVDLDSLMFLDSLLLDNFNFTLD